MTVAQSDGEAASFETGFEIEYPEHPHAIFGYWCAIGWWVSVAGGVGTFANSARVIFPLHGISVLVSDIEFFSFPT